MLTAIAVLTLIAVTSIGTETLGRIGAIATTKIMMPLGWMLTPTVWDLTRLLIPPFGERFSTPLLLRVSSGESGGLECASFMRGAGPGAIDLHGLILTKHRLRKLVNLGKLAGQRASPGAIDRALEETQL